MIYPYFLFLYVGDGGVIFLDYFFCKKKLFHNTKM